MAAPAPVVYRSTDASAPVLDGTVGSLINVLDACLRTGYGSKAGAGWTKPFIGTNAASFKQGGGNGFYLDVADNGAGANTSMEAWTRAYETMTAVATGTGAFPTTAQLPTTGIIVRKSAAATAATRVWTLIADDRTFYLFNQSGDSAGCWYCTGFGDFYSYVAGTDGFRTFIMGRASAGGSLTTENADKIANSVAGHYIPRSYTGLGGSFNYGKIGDQAKAGTNLASTLFGALTAPSPVDGRIWIAPVFVLDAAGAAIRGKQRGFMHYLHTVASFADQDTVAGTGVYAGRTFLLFKTTGNAAAYCIDITGPWDAN